MTELEMRQKRQRQEAQKAEVSRFKEAEPAVCLFSRKERRDGETDGRKRWPCLLPIRAIMSDDEGETEGGRGAERMWGEGKGET